MNEYNFNVKFEKGRISSNLKKLVQNDYNSTKINFTFDKEGRKLFKMLYPDGSIYITQIDNNELIFGPGILSQEGLYEIEITVYTEDGRLTDYATTKFNVRAELIQSDEIVEIDDRLPVLDNLINDIEEIKKDVADGKFNGKDGEPGPQGEKGDKGEQGPAGEDGLSAYEVYLKNGGTLSETEWLESLKGNGVNDYNDLLNKPIKYLKGVDNYYTEDPPLLRDIETGVYIANGTFKAYVGTMKMHFGFNNSLVIAKHEDTKTIIMNYSYNKITYYEVTDDNVSRVDFPTKDEVTTMINNQIGTINEQLASLTEVE